ncbi:TRAP transporter small permease [Alcaligenaceae bacterium CGII-47]|nr:TRAP transporter small permease [Alcaligenaceae bacterium CGII-47]
MRAVKSQSVFRRLIAGLCQAAGIISAAMLVSMVSLILIQITGRIVGFRFLDAGELSGYLLAAMSFLALAYTFREGGHIRVNVLIANLAGKRRWVVEVLCLLVAIAITAFFSWSSVILTLESYQFGARSTGLMAIELWIPQLGMAIGSVLLSLTLLEGLIDVLRGDMPAYQRAELSNISTAE